MCGEIWGLKSRLSLERNELGSGWLLEGKQMWASEDVHKGVLKAI